jgi:hypothetical protein
VGELVRHGYLLIAPKGLAAQVKRASG